MSKLEEVPSRNPLLDYSKSTHPFVISRFILECSRKLQFSVLASGTAASLFHSFRHASQRPEAYDPYLMAGASLYLAGKIEEESHIRLRDILNVLRSTLHPGKDLLQHDSEYFNHREAIVEAELLLLRILDFRLKFSHPHPFLLQYLKSLRDWLDPELWSEVPIASSAWKMLQDFYHDPFILEWRGSLVAISLIHLTLQIYGVEVPYLPKETDWIKALDDSVDMKDVMEIESRILNVYNDETKLIQPLILEKTIKE
ncbi:Cyclin-related protein FAM58A [Caligus rogercresseyi]|uniref:Cyclin-Q n=1 Tax=Caligus rogercresseyi TaxID=217165 RepID=C1BRR3_CALRO|nr:Cyclin-related protein FAM58A [Caligus rogercresseyi]QQP38566.1 Cyclin-related protein FAM58A [Caligus rogercresseyi]